MVIDEKIHYRVMKFYYSSTYVSWDLRPMLSKCPPVFAIWHPYKYSATPTYRLLVIICCITHGSPELAVEVQAFPKLIYLERVVACLLVAPSDVKAQLHVFVNILAQWGGDMSGRARRIKCNVDGLNTLLFEYVPALFLLGTPVCDRNSGSGDSTLVKKALHCSLHIVMRLTQGREHLVEYVRSVITAILLWSSWMMGILAACHSEEMCEAMLLRPISSMRRHPQMNNVDSRCDLYLLLKPANQHAKDLVKRCNPIGLYPTIATNLPRLVHGLLNDNVPAIQWKRTKTVAIQTMWARVLSSVIINYYGEESLGRPLSQLCSH